VSKLQGRKVLEHSRPVLWLEPSLMPWNVSRTRLGFLAFDRHVQQRHLPMSSLELLVFVHYVRIIIVFVIGEINILLFFFFTGLFFESSLLTF